MSNIKLYHEDLPDGFELSGDIAIDTETMGLQHHRDRLCLVQLSNGDGLAHLVKFSKDSDYAAANLRLILADSKSVKIMHYARFDMAMIYNYFGIMLESVFCTKIASRLARTYTDRHSLAALCRELLSVELNKQQQSSDWGNSVLSDKQLSYAASDVLYLHDLRLRLVDLLEREGRYDLALSCFNFLSARCDLDLRGWGEIDIFAHS